MEPTQKGICQIVNSVDILNIIPFYTKSKHMHNCQNKPIKSFTLASSSVFTFSALDLSECIQKQSSVTTMNTTETPSTTVSDHLDCL